MKLTEATEYFGGVKGLAEAIGITTQAIYQWGGIIPAVRQYQIQVITKGRLKAAPHTKGRTAA